MIILLLLRGVASYILGNPRRVAQEEKPVRVELRVYGMGPRWEHDRALSSFAYRMKFESYSYSLSVRPPSLEWWWLPSLPAPEWLPSLPAPEW